VRPAPLRQDVQTIGGEGRECGRRPAAVGNVVAPNDASLSARQLRS
jgi:hypothetical protein